MKTTSAPSQSASWRFAEAAAVRQGLFDENGFAVSLVREALYVEVERLDFQFFRGIEEGTVFELSGFSGSQMARVGRAVIESSLPSALVFELSKSL